MLFFNTLLASAIACPSFVEFYPDPTDTTDSFGEFLEIVLDSNLSKDTLFIKQEGKTEIPYFGLNGNRLLLHRDTTTCIKRDGLICLPLEFSPLPNSRETEWLLRQGTCKDSVFLPNPKAGKSLQKEDSLNSWVYTNPSPGLANPLFEKSVKDCQIEILKQTFLQDKFKVSLALKNCDSAKVAFKSSKLDFSNKITEDTLNLYSNLTLEIPSDGSPELLDILLLNDDFPENDSLQTLLISKKEIPLSLTEIHFCPEEGKSEWVEVYNLLPVDLPLNGFSFCNRADIALKKAMPYESILFTKDTIALREEIGFNEVRLSKANFGALKNTADTLCLCFLNDTLECVNWDKQEHSFCPSGFNVLSRKKENTPGIQNKRLSKKELKNLPFTVEWNSRLFSQKKVNECRVRLKGNVNVSILLFNEHGNLLWQHTEDASKENWLLIPIRKYYPGIYFIKFISGNYEKTISVVLRP